MSAQTGRPEGNTSRLTLIVILAVTAVVYALWMTAVWSESEDSLTFITRINADIPRYHPNHLIFEPFYHLVVSGVERIAPGIAPLTIMQSLTLVFSLIALGALYLLVEARNGSAAAALATGFIAVSFGFWHYATTVDAYIPALAFALLTLLCLDRRPPHSSLAWACLAALLASCAVLFHQLYVFFAAIIGVFILFGGRRGGVYIGEAFVYAVTGLVVVLGAYILSYLGPDRVQAEGLSFLVWASGYAKNGLGAPTSANEPIMAIVGITRVMITLNPFLGIPAVSSVAASMAGDKLFVEELFVGTTVLGPSLSMALAACALLGLLLALVFAVSALASLFRKRPDGFKALLLVLIVLYAVLAVIWEGVNKELWFHVVAFLAIVVFANMRSDQNWLRAVSLASILLLATSNFFGAIRPYNTPTNDYWNSLLAPVYEVAAPGDLVIINCPWLCEKHIEGLTGADVLMPAFLTTEEALSEYDRVFLSSIAYHATKSARGGDGDPNIPLQAFSTAPLPAPSPEAHDVWRRDPEGWTPASHIDWRHGLQF